MYFCSASCFARIVWLAISKSPIVSYSSNSFRKQMTDKTTHKTHDINASMIPQRAKDVCLLHGHYMKKLNCLTQILKVLMDDRFGNGFREKLCHFEKMPLSRSCGAVVLSSDFAARTDGWTEFDSKQSRNNSAS